MSFRGMLGLRAINAASNEGALPCQMASTDPLGTSGHRQVPTVTISVVAPTARAYPYNKKAMNLTATQWIGDKYRLMNSSAASIILVMRFLPTL
jgi:hypothetical protein